MRWTLQRSDALLLLPGLYLPALQTPPKNLHDLTSSLGVPRSSAADNTKLFSFSNWKNDPVGADGMFKNQLQPADNR